MLSYNTRSEFASASPAWLPGELVEELYGKDSAKAGNVQRTPAGWLILDGDYRPATTLETAGIDSAMVKMAEALASFAGYDEIEALDITLAGYDQVDIDFDDLADAADWLDYIDTRESIRFGFSMF